MFIVYIWIGVSPTFISVRSVLQEHTHTGVIYEQAVVSSLLPSWVLAMAGKCIRCPAFCPNLNSAFSTASQRGQTMLAHNSTDIINYHQTAL